VKNIMDFAQNSKNIKILFISIIIFFTIWLNVSLYSINTLKNENKIKKDLSPKPSIVYSYFLNLTNPIEVNNSNFRHNESITVRGTVYNPYLGGGQPNVNVTLILDGIDLSALSDFNARNKTDVAGNFEITTKIPMWANIYSPILITVNVTDPKNTKYNHHYLIYSTADSKMVYEETNNYPKVSGEKYEVAGTLSLDNNTVISGMEVNGFWRIDGVDSSSSVTFVTDTNGNFSGQISLPSTGWNTLSLVLNSSATPEINYSSQIIDNLLVFPNFTCSWYLPENIMEGDNITVRGELSSSINSSFKIFNRSINIYFGRVLIKQLTTNSSGGFSFEFQASDNGTLAVATDNLLNLPVQSSILVNVSAAAAPPPPGGFLIDPVFIIVLIVIVAGSITAVYFFSKRKAAEPKIVEIPLEKKLENITILKDTDRREESVVYLFYIFLQLSEAKYGIIKQPNETINDYAIKCVKEMGLAPLLIYPFIKKIEQILYGSGGKISEEDFKEIFSQFIALFYDFTGYQIKL